MVTIWKYEIPLIVGDRFPLAMPKGAVILDVQVRRGIPVLWAIVNPGEESVRRDFLLVGTGCELPPNRQQEEYIGTFQVGENLVLHLFETVII